MNFLFFLFLLGACLGLTNAITLENCCKRCHPRSGWLGVYQPYGKISYIDVNFGYFVLGNYMDRFLRNV
ncbi:unnamed protein product [Cylicocyclus nassatus]|uniref:Uncharacterized protein n=1 Tax=Cylicocyclus nassatus TaxID=53992 RepID=A0AA36M571_CYLNA|nr:unnamed protein product [Cylicocyclus nassatus]